MSHGEGRGGIILKSGYIIQSQSVIFWFLVFGCGCGGGGVFDCNTYHTLLYGRPRSSHIIPCGGVGCYVGGI